MRDAPAAVLGPLRTLISVAFLAVLLWGAFAIKLGDRTFADHMDRIGETEEAKALLDGARGRVGPALEEVKQRLMGEYVEAPTYMRSVAPPGPPAVVTVRPGPASTEESGRLPGRKVAAGALFAAPGNAQAKPAERDPRGKERAKPRSVEVVVAEEQAKHRSVEVVVPATKKPKPGSAEPADAGKLPGRRASR